MSARLFLPPVAAALLVGIADRVSWSDAPPAEDLAAPRAESGRSLALSQADDRDDCGHTPAARAVEFGALQIF